MSTSSDSSSSTTTTVYAGLAFGGGLLLAFSQLPQIHRVHKRRATFDISYGYQVIYATASTMFLIYYGYYKIWSIFVPCTMSFVFILYLMGVKIYLEEYIPRKAEGSEPMGSRLGSALLPEANVNGGQADGDSEIQ